MNDTQTEPLVCEAHPWRQFESPQCRREGCAGPGAPCDAARWKLAAAMSVLEACAARGVPEARGFLTGCGMDVPDLPAGWDEDTGNF